jgi:hypothetical protein
MLKTVAVVFRVLAVVIPLAVGWHIAPFSICLSIADVARKFDRLNILLTLQQGRLVHLTPARVGKQMFGLGLMRWSIRELQRNEAQNRSCTSATFISAVANVQRFHPM